MRIAGWYAAGGGGATDVPGDMTSSGMGALLFLRSSGGQRCVREGEPRHGCDSRVLPYFGIVFFCLVAVVVVGVPLVWDGLLDGLLALWSCGGIRALARVFLGGSQVWGSRMLSVVTCTGLIPSVSRCGSLSGIIHIFLSLAIGWLLSRRNLATDKYLWSRAQGRLDGAVEHPASGKSARMRNRIIFCSRRPRCPALFQHHAIGGITHARITQDQDIIISASHLARPISNPLPLRPRHAAHQV